MFLCCLSTCAAWSNAGHDAICPEQNMNRYGTQVVWVVWTVWIECDVIQAKTIEEIRAEAHAELGMMPATLIPALESLSALPRQADEVELFPSFKGGRPQHDFSAVSGGVVHISVNPNSWTSLGSSNFPRLCARACKVCCFLSGYDCYNGDASPTESAGSHQKTL